MLELRTEVKQGEKMVSTGLHDGPHIDDIFGRWMVETMADGEFLRKYAPQGALTIGCGGGPLDEHTGEKEKEGECAATLVARALGVENEPPLELLLNYIRFTDTGKPRDPKNLKSEERHHPLEPANIVKRLNEMWPQNPEKVITLVEQAIIEPVFLDQWKFFRETKPEFEKVSEIEEIVGPNGKKLILVAVRSNDEKMQRFARSKFGARADVVIQRKLSGQTQIFTNKGAKLDLDDTAGIIRFEEQVLKERLGKGHSITTDWKILRSEGIVPGVEEWCYFRRVMLLNGPLSHPDVPPTKLSLEKIKSCVKIGLNPKVFEPSRAAICKKGRCTSTREYPCPWRKWGLQRCRDTRFNKMKNRHNTNRKSI